MAGTPERTSPQLDLFPSRGPVAVAGRWDAVVRTALDARSWIEEARDWLSGADGLFEELARSLPWEQRHRRVFEQLFLEPRLTAEYRSLQGAPPALVAAAEALSEHYRVRHDSLWLNFYRSGQDSTGFHRDRFSCRRPECIVPVLTLGASRRFLIKPRGGGAAREFRPRSGDLLVMGGRCQGDWVHGVPRSPNVLGARISVNFQSAFQAGRRG